MNFFCRLLLVKLKYDVCTLSRARKKRKYRVLRCRAQNLISRHRHFAIPSAFIKSVAPRTFSPKRISQLKTTRAALLVPFRSLACFVSLTRNIAGSLLFSFLLFFRLLKGEKSAAPLRWLHERWKIRDVGNRIDKVEYDAGAVGREKLGERVRGVCLLASKLITRHRGGKIVSWRRMKVQCGSCLFIFLQNVIFCKSTLWGEVLGSV